MADNSSERARAESMSDRNWESRATKTSSKRVLGEQGAKAESKSNRNWESRATKSNRKQKLGEQGAWAKARQQQRKGKSREHEQQKLEEQSHQNQQQTGTGREGSKSREHEQPKLRELGHHKQQQADIGRAGSMSKGQTASAKGQEQEARETETGRTGPPKPAAWPKSRQQQQQGKNWPPTQRVQLATDWNSKMKERPGEKETKRSSKVGKEF